ncbi:hypothetical protein [Paenibacillus oleatilyticus]|uniref:MotA/TolQ/ExbB proton channel domain-containing protein n=1 Tax=Paenibacillus oleatilyticus TaxID=2594886 RepID=A0ABV4V5I1_9BACL
MTFLDNLTIISVIYCICEFIRTQTLRLELEKPLEKLSVKWKVTKRKNRNIIIKKRLEIDRLLYCYSQLTNEEMDNQEILLESKESDAGLIQQILELLFKIIIPIITFVLLALLTTNNNLLNIFTKKAESDPKAYDSIGQIAVTFEEKFVPIFMALLSIAFSVFLIAASNMFFSNRRKSRIKLHLDVIKKVKENKKNTDSEKEN